MRPSEPDLLRYRALAKSDSLCIVVELVGTACGLSGLGIMLAGRPVLGVVCLLAWWLVLFGVFALSLAGGWIVAIPAALVWWALVVFSAGSAARTHNRKLADQLYEASQRAGASGGFVAPREAAPSSVVRGVVGGLGIVLMAVVLGVAGVAMLGMWLATSG